MEFVQYCAERDLYEVELAETDKYFSARPHLILVQLQSLPTISTHGHAVSSQAERYVRKRMKLRRMRQAGATIFAE